MLKLEGISKTFHPGTADSQKVFDSLSLDVARGEFVTIIGANGAGKSTLFNIIAGTVAPDSGRVVLGGEDITFTPVHIRSKNIGRLFQDPMKGTAPGLSIEENLALAAGRGGWFSHISRADRESFRERLAMLGMGLEERMKHLSDTFSEYLLYLIHNKHMENADVYKRAIVDKKTFSKIKNNKDYHPQKLTALCLCVGAKLNLDESIDLLARAGYALSPCDKTDIIFSFFIENEIYDMIELDIQLEEHGLPCIIS